MQKKGNLLLWLIFSVSRELQYCSGLDDLKWSQSQQPVTLEDKALSKSLKWHREINGKHLRLTSIEVLYNLMFLKRLLLIANNLLTITLFFVEKRDHHLWFLSATLMVQLQGTKDTVTKSFTPCKSFTILRIKSNRLLLFWL